MTTPAGGFSSEGLAVLFGNRSLAAGSAENREKSSGKPSRTFKAWSHEYSLLILFVLLWVMWQ